MVCTVEKLSVRYKREVKAAIRQLDALTKEGVEATSDGTTTDRLLQSYTRIYKQLGDDPERLVDSIEAMAQLESDVLYTTVRRELKDVFNASIGSGLTVNTRTDVPFSLVDIQKINNTYELSVSPVSDGKISDTVYKYTFEKGVNVSNPTSKGSRLYIPKIDVAFNRADKRLQDIAYDKNRTANRIKGQDQLNKIRDYLSDKTVTLGSDTASYSREGFKQRPDYTHGDIEHMKSVLQELQVLGNNRATDEHYEHLERLFDKMHPSFFREMSLHINEDAKDTAGWVNLDEKSILLNLGEKRPLSKSEAEVYAHEVVHTMSAWALDQDNKHVSPIKRELHYTMRKAVESTTWEDFLGKRVKDSTEAEQLQAKAMYDYVFTSKNSENEFIAHVLTNPVVMSHMKKVKLKGKADAASSMFERVVELFYKLLDVVLGKYRFKDANNNVYEQVNTLAFKLAKINTKAEGDISKLDLPAQVNLLISEKDQAINDWVTAKAEDISGKIKTVDDISKSKVDKLPKNATLHQKAWFVLKFVGKATYNEYYRKSIGLVASSYFIKPEGTIREVLGSLFTPTELERAVEWASLQNSNIDTLRNTKIDKSRRQVIDGFKTDLTEEQEVSLTRAVLDTNLSTLLHSNTDGVKPYTKEDLQEVLSDSAKLDSKILQAEERLEERLVKLRQSSRTNWVLNQANGLGYFMGTHRANVAQNLNAENIVKGYISEERHKLDSELVGHINEVASLVALRHTKPRFKESLADLLETDFGGVKNLAAVYEAFKVSAQEKSFKGDTTHMISGYSKELFDDTTDIEFADINRRTELEAKGYKFYGEVKPQHGERRKKQIGMFVSDLYGKPERERGAINLGKYQSRGVSLKDISYIEHGNLGGKAFSNNKKLVEAQTNKTSWAMTEGRMDVTKLPHGLVPILDLAGKPVDYRYMTQDKDDKAKRMKQDLRVTEVMSRSVGSLVDKELREGHNLKVLEVVKELMSKKYYKGGTLGGETGLDEYRLLGPNVKDPELRRLYHMLPRSFQEFAATQKNGNIAVPANLLYPLVGYEHLQMSNLLDTRLGKPIPLAWRRVIKRVLDLAEGYWIDLIKIAKGNILLKMPMVLVSNIVSNTLFMLNTGIGPTQLWKLHKESFKDSKAFMFSHKEVVRLELQVELNKAKLINASNKKEILAEIKRDEVLISRHNKSMEDNPVKELIDAGMFQSVVEDVETAQLNDTNKISIGMDKLLSKAPKIVKTGAQILYLSKETKWYQFNQEVLQLSDLIARDVMNRKQKELELEMVSGKRSVPKALADELGGVEKGEVLTGDKKDRFLAISKDARMNLLLDSFINYNKPNSRFEEYLNRIGLLMFTKYIKRIQRIIVNTATTHPLRTLALLAAASLAIDVDTIQDQAYLARGFGFDGDFSVSNIIPTYGPMDSIMNVVTPALIKEETYMGLI